MYRKKFLKNVLVQILIGPSVSTLLLKLWWHDATSVITANREIVTLNCSYYCGYNVVLRLDL